ncbi:hypothetical protein D3C76_1738380 [compost metagenome]
MQPDQLLRQKPDLDGDPGLAQAADIPKQGAVVANHYHGRGGIIGAAIGDTLALVGAKGIQQNIDITATARLV